MENHRWAADGGPLARDLRQIVSQHTGIRDSSARSTTSDSDPWKGLHMRKVRLAAALVITAMARLLNAQNVPATIREAEAEGAGRPHESAEVPSQSYFKDSRFAGTAERRCVSDAAYPVFPDGSLRSGDFILRGGVGGPLGFLAGKGKKVLWAPLHGSPSRKPPLVLRAVRIGNPDDSVRFRIEGLVHGGRGPQALYGYVSEASLPTAGQWLVVATAGNDWGCFVLKVEPPRGSN